MAPDWPTHSKPLFFLYSLFFFFFSFPSFLLHSTRLSGKFGSTKEHWDSFFPLDAIPKYKRRRRRSYVLQFPSFSHWGFQIVQNWAEFTTQRTNDHRAPIATMWLPKVLCRPLFVQVLFCYCAAWQLHGSNRPHCVERKKNKRRNSSDTKKVMGRLVHVQLACCCCCVVRGSFFFVIFWLTLRIH